MAPAALNGDQRALDDVAAGTVVESWPAAFGVAVDESGDELCDRFLGSIGDFRVECDAQYLP